MTDIRHVTIDSEDLSGQSYPYQHDIGAVEDIDLLAATPGPDLNWLEDVHLLAEDGVAAVFDRYSNSFSRFTSRSRRGERTRSPRKVLIAHLQAGKLVRHPAEARPHQVPPTHAGAVAGGLRDRRSALGAPHPRGLGVADRPLVGTPGARPRPKGDEETHGTTEVRPFRRDRGGGPRPLDCLASGRRPRQAGPVPPW